MKKLDLEKIDHSMEEIQREYEGFLLQKSKMKPWNRALRIVLVYIIVGVLWVLLSDRVVYLLIEDPVVQGHVQSYKGWFYVFATGGIFCYLIWKTLRLYEKATDKVLSGYETLIMTHEELLSVNEDLKEYTNKVNEQQRDLLESEQRYQLAVEGVNDGIWDWDLKSGHYFFSLKRKKLYGYTEDDFAPTIDAWMALVHPDDQERVDKTILDYLMRDSDVYEITYRLRCKDSNYRWILSKGKAIWDQTNEAIRMAGSHTDVTDMIKLQESLLVEKEFSSGIISGASCIIIVYGTDGRVVHFNSYAEKVFHIEKEAVIGRKLSDLFHVRTKDVDVRTLLAKTFEGQGVTDEEIEVICLDGSKRTILWSCNALYDKNGAIEGLVSVGTDITERRLMEERLQQSAYYDSLTGLPNRAYLEKVADEAIEKGAEFAIVNLDMDNFKHINDTMGHNTGDDFIKTIAKLLQEVTEAPDVVARLSGDQFGLLFHKHGHKLDLKTWVNQILDKFRSKWSVADQKFLITVSIGIALYPEHGQNFSLLMKNADIALFYQKSNGRDGVSFFHESMSTRALLNVEMSNQLKDAIENEEFILYYQPQYALDSGRIVGLEALIRWNHPQKGFIPPSDFIPFSEQAGYIIPISEWVVRRAIEQKREWERKGFPSVKMAVNLSGHIFSKESNFDNICRIFEELQVKPDEIEVEVTETAVMMELEKAKLCLEKLKDMGISIAMDDFGTGYSSLNYLQILPFDVLKIDKAFIDNITNQKENYIYRTVVDLAHAFGLSVVAEGVETKEQKRFLIETSCDIGQGYYYSRPVPPEEIEKIL